MDGVPIKKGDKISCILTTDNFPAIMGTVHKINIHTETLLIVADNGGETIIRPASVCKVIP